MHRQQGSIYPQKVKQKDGTIWVSPNYTIAYYVGPRLKREVVSPSKKEAARILNDRLAALHSGSYREITEITFGQYVERWVAGLGYLKPSTAAAYRSSLTKCLIPAFGEFPLNAIGVERVNAYLAERAEEAKPKTLRNQLALLHKLFADALEQGYLAVNRLNGSKALRRPRPLREDDEREIEILIPEEVNRLLDAVDPDYYPYFLTAACTGMRLGELIGLEWGDIEWERKQIWVRRTFYRGEPYRPKTRRSRRAIDVGDQLLSVLWGLRSSLPHPPKPKAPVFLAPNGTRIDPDNLRHRVWEPALAAAGLRHVTMHSLRHFYASVLIQNGENIKYISAQLGHASAQITLDRYGHLFPDEKRQSAQRFEERLGFMNALGMNGAGAVPRDADEPRGTRPRSVEESTRIPSRVEER